MSRRAPGCTLFVLLSAVSAPLLAQVPRQAQASAVETGQINGAAFRIEIPASWNKGLIM